MKTKTIIYTGLLTLALTGMLFTGCKKDDTTTKTETTDDSAELQQDGNDNAMVQSNDDKALDDANAAMDATTLSGKTEGVGSFTVCDASLTTDTTAKKVTITYSEANSCPSSNVKRSGTITLQLTGANRWKDEGAVLTMKFINYKVTRKSDTASVTYNGTRTITNVHGGTIFTLATSTPIVHKIRAIDMSITFDNGTTRTWSSARERTITYNSGIVTVTAKGDTTLSGTPNTEFWGTNRNGKSFTSTLTSFSANNDCGFNRPTLGVMVRKVGLRTITVTLGVDALGEVVTTGCPTHYKIAYTNALGKTKTAVVQY